MQRIIASGLLVSLLGLGALASLGCGDKNEVKSQSESKTTTESDPQPIVTGDSK